MGKGGFCVSQGGSISMQLCVAEWLRASILSLDKLSTTYVTISLSHKQSRCRARSSKTLLIKSMREEYDNIDV